MVPMNREKLFEYDKTKIKYEDQMLLNASYFNNLAGVQKWLKLGGNLHYMENRDGWMAVHYAARWGNITMVKFLIDHGADINSKTNSKETILHKCARWDRIDIAIYLLELGANPYIKNLDGYMAADMTNNDELKRMIRDFDTFGIQYKERKYKVNKLEKKERISIVQRTFKDMIYINKK